MWNPIKKQASKQNITRDIEIKNNLTVIRGEVGEDNRERRGNFFQNNYKGHMDKKPRGYDIKGGKWGWLGWEGVVGGKCRQLYLNNNKIIKLNKNAI